MNWPRINRPLHKLHLADVNDKSMPACKTIPGFHHVPTIVADKNKVTCWRCLKVLGVSKRVINIPKEIT